ncbi:hypothetical protein [Brucella intermedia]|uniref:hypothetical protein n=1 Tax=Brucella intermedia TaxID=94625 RepID=UPI002248EA78|nr:hypothetical protein [Brucella intermedia]
MKLSNDEAFTLIKNAARVDGTLAEPFSARDLRDVIRGWKYTDYFSFLAYNCTENAPVNAALFVRVDRGRYCIFDQPEHLDPNKS